jgi:hypothetical protein
MSRRDDVASVHHRVFPRRRLVTRFLTKGGMPVTMCRLNLVKGLGPALQIAEGWTVDLPEKVHDVLDQRTNPTWPTTWFAPILTGQGAFRDVYSVMNNWGANHGAIGYGHVGADLITLAAMLRIPVYMHNVPEETSSAPAPGTPFRHRRPRRRGFPRRRGLRQRSARSFRIVAEDNTISLDQFVRAHFLVNAAQRLDCGCAFAERFPKASAFDGNIVPARVTRDT